MTDAAPAYPFELLVDLSDPETMRERVRACGTARAGGWFWLPCPLCGLEFGGQEWMQGSPEKPASICRDNDSPGTRTGICPYCTMAGRGAVVRS